MGRVEDPRAALIGTLALFAATVAALFGIALASDREPSAVEDDEAPAAELDPARLLELSVESTPRVARRVEDIRGLEFDEVPRPEISDVARLQRLTERELAKPRVQRQLRTAETELRLLGLLEEDQTLTEVATDSSALAVAYYDPRRGELFMVGDAVPAGAQLAEFVLAHELTHALEDQRYGLPKTGGISDDRMLAETAMVEGTATAVMDSYARRHLDPFALVAESAALDGGTGGELPRFAESEVSFTYVDGARFVEELLRLGNEWALVDYALEERPPATTEQILHPEKYVDDEPAVPVSPAAAPGPEWRPLDTGSLGEFGTREVLRAGEPGLGADLGAEGWGGDRYRLFGRRDADRACDADCRTSYALGLAWRGDTPRDAAELSRQLETYLAEGLDGERLGGGSWRLEDGWADLRAMGDRVAVGLAPDASSAEALTRLAGSN
jgi:hypothetical protein